MIEAIVGVALRAILASVLLGGILAALALVATRTLSLTAATRHALWTTALIATALMPLAGIGMSIARATAAAAPAAPAPPANDETFVVVDSGRMPALATPPPAPPFVERVRSADRLAFAAWTPRVSRVLAFGVVGIWALGALIGVIGLAASIGRVRGLKRRSSPLDGALADELPWLTEVGPGREIYLRLSYETETPVAIGFRRPVILIPTELATADGLTAIESLILHEHAHLRRNDDWTNLLQRAIERVFWFNPIVWFVGRRIALEREIASDDAVVEKTGEAHAYAASLWKLVREMRMPEHAVVAPGALLTRKQITVRIELLLDKKRARLHRSPAAAFGIAIAGVLSVAFVASSAPAVELPAPVQVTAGAPPMTDTTRRAKVPAKRLAVAATTTRTMWKAVSAKSGGTNDAPSKAMREQLHLLRAQLAAAKARPTTVHVNAIGIVNGKHGSYPAPPSAIVPSLPALPALPAPSTTPAFAAMAVIGSPADGAPVQSDAKLQKVKAAVARVCETARVRYEIDIERTIKAAMATIPRRIEIEISSGSAHSRFAEMMLSREIAAAQQSEGSCRVEDLIDMVRSS